MSSYELYGNTYYYVVDHWTDCNNNKVQAKIADELNQKYPDAGAKRKKPGKPNKKGMTNSGTSKSNTSYYKAKEFRKKVKPHNYMDTVVLTESQKNALKVLESGESVFLTGEAGTGKSFVLQEFIRRNKNKNIVVCAPTGIAAINIGGSTLHRVFGVPLGAVRPGDGNKEPSDVLIRAEIVIIDEISMCRIDVFEYVVQTLLNAINSPQNSNNCKKQLILVGDFFQLPPVITDGDRAILNQYFGGDIGYGFAFKSTLWNKIVRNNIVLSEIVRQGNDIEFAQNLNKIRVGDYSAIDWFNDHVSRDVKPNGIFLCGTNREAESLNEIKAGELGGEAIEYKAQISGDVKESDKLTADVLILKENMQVMTLVNNFEEGYQNGSIGRIVKLHKGAVEVELDNGKTVTVGPYEWEIVDYEVQEEKVERVVAGKFKQLPLKMAYAITIHKSQGQTYSSANIHPNCFSPGQLYVALSRVKSVSDMSLAHNITRRSLITSKEVKDFYLSLNGQT